MASERHAAIAEDARELFGPLPCDVLIEGERPLLTAAPGESLEAAVNRMWWRKVGALPVVHEGRLVGCFAEEELLAVLDARLRERDAAAESALVWSELLADVYVRDAMTPVSKLPVVGHGDSLLEGLRQCCGAEAPRGRYLFLVDSHGEGDAVQLASFRDVARLLARVYEGAGPYPDAATGARGVAACRRLLSVPIGTLRREIALGHDPSLVAEASYARDVVRTMAERGRGYVLVTLPKGGPIGICTRRDVLEHVRPHNADLARLSLQRLMSHRVLTVFDENTLLALFQIMGSVSCRHLPLMDERDHVQSVISMWEAIALVCGEEA